MKKTALLAILVMPLFSFAQQFYLPFAWLKDSASIEKNLPALASRVAAAYKESDRTTYFDNLFRLQLAAGDDKAALSSIDSLRHYIALSDSVRGRVIGIQFEAFAKARIAQRESNQGFSTAFQQVFPKIYQQLPLPSAVYVSNYFAAELDQVKAQLDEQLKDRPGKDSIEMQDAIALLKAIGSWQVYSQVMPFAGPAIKELERTAFIVEDSVVIRTRDGASLSAVIARPRNISGKLPCIFVFNIYTSGRDRTKAKEAASKGFAGIVVNTRGKNLSPQEIEPFEHDANDAYDVIDWISKQPWSDGKVGMMGGSYLGFAQWAAAKKVHPALKTIIPQVAVGAGIDYPMNNNVFMSYMLRWIHYVTNSRRTDQFEFDNEKHWSDVFRNWYASGKSFRSLDTLEGRPNVIFQRWLKHPSLDTFWQKMVPYKNDFSRINIPVLTTTGYYDADQRGAMYYFMQHMRYNPSAKHYFVIGPYDHPGAQGSPARVLLGYKIDSVANISINELAYQWFNHILKDSARPQLLRDKINYQPMGSNQWKHRPSLDASSNESLHFYLGTTREHEHYLLETKKSSALEFIRQQVNFADRSDSAGEGLDDQIISDKIGRLNVLSFVSPAFKEPFEFTGSFSGELDLSVNKKDLDIEVDVFEARPDGKYFTLSYYLGRASFAKDPSKRQLLVPGRIMHIPFSNTMFTSKKIEAGSRLVFLVGVAKSPYWQINYGTGKDVSDETIADGKIPLHVKWYNSSVIHVPVFR